MSALENLMGMGFQKDGEKAVGVKKDGWGWAVDLGECDLVDSTRTGDGTKKGIKMGDRVV